MISEPVGRAVGISVPVRVVPAFVNVKRTGLLLAELVREDREEELLLLSLLSLVLVAESEAEMMVASCALAPRAATQNSQRLLGSSILSPAACVYRAW